MKYGLGSQLQGMRKEGTVDLWFLRELELETCLDSQLKGKRELGVHPPRVERLGI